MTTKTMIATGRTVNGALVVESATAAALADIAIADLQAANLRTCQALGIIPPDAATGLAQHAALVEAAKGKP